MGFYYLTNNKYYKIEPLKIEKLYNIISDKLIVTDTRKVVEKAIFFALKGDNFNGNAFAQQALEKGASFAIIDDEKYIISKKTILVNDVLNTLQQLAAYHRQQLEIPIVALTGSNGKTTTKELINAVLSKKYNVKATAGNLNNHIGVPLSILAMTKLTEIGVVEMGANHLGEIAFLCQIAQPNFGYVTNFGKAHLEGFGSLEGVVKAKSELYHYLKENDQQVFVNTDDAIQVKQTLGLKQIQFNSKEIKFKSADPFVEIEYKGHLIKSQLLGKYNYDNIAAAIAIGAHFKVEAVQIKEAIENYLPENNRSQIINKGDLQIILDAYNANPTSMRLAIENFMQFTSQSKILVLGDMFELGDSTQKEHQGIVDLLETFNFDKAYLIGNNFKKTINSNTKILQFNTFKEFKNHFKVPKNAVLLIKASRGMALERVLDLL